MQQSNILREITNLPLSQNGEFEKEAFSPLSSDRSEGPPRPTLDELMSISQQEINFGYCLPGSIHERNFAITLKTQMQFPCDLQLLIVCDDQALYDSSSLVYGVKRLGQNQYYDEYRLKVKDQKSYEFKIGVQTPMFYQYNVQSVLYIHFMDYAPLAVVLKQKAQVPELITTRQLYIQDSRMLKLSYIHGRGKKDCRVPFKLNHPMTLSVIAEVMGLETQSNPTIDVKPRSMTLSGKGQFSLSISMNLDNEIIQSLANGIPKIVRRILTLTIKDTKFIYHFPLEVTYFPEPSKSILE